MNITRADAVKLAGDVLEAMSQDSGPIQAEPFASWARRLALAVLDCCEPDAWPAMGHD